MNKENIKKSSKKEMFFCCKNLIKFVWYTFPCNVLFHNSIYYIVEIKKKKLYNKL